MTKQPSGDGAASLNAKPLRADARRNRERVLEAARAAFAGEGISVPLDEIARRAGVGAGTVYRHFPTKEVLFEAVMVGNLEELTAEARALAAEADPASALFEYIRRMVAHGAVNRALADGLARAGISIGGEVRRVGLDHIRALDELLTRAQGAGMVRLDVTSDQVKALALGVLAANDQLGGDDELRRHLIAVLCDGLRTRE